jgi:purine-binding chemotaxis protein CheW
MDQTNKISNIADPQPGTDCTLHGRQVSRHMVFMLAGEKCALDITGVQFAVVSPKLWTTALLPLPNAPNYVHGVLDLEGDIVPIIDLRPCFDLAPIGKDADMPILVLKLIVDGEERKIGLVVDAVSGTKNISEDQVIPTDKFIQRDIIIGVATIDTQTVIILDLVKLLVIGEMTVLSQKCC